MGARGSAIAIPTPLRWLAFWFPTWEAAKEHMSLLWLAWLTPQLDAMA